MRTATERERGMPLTHADTPHCAQCAYAATLRADGACDYLSPQWLAFTGSRAATHLGDGAYGAATGKKLTYRIIADCHAIANQINDEWLIRDQVADVLDIVTPTEPARRGCQLSLRVKGPRDSGRELFEHLQKAGIVVDWREPDM